MKEEGGREKEEILIDIASLESTEAGGISAGAFIGY